MRVRPFLEGVRVQVVRWERREGREGGWEGERMAVEKGDGEEGEEEGEGEGGGWGEEEEEEE